MIDFPVTLRFKLFALASQISVRDAQDREVLYVKQKLFKLREHVLVYRDDSMQELLFEIRANKIIDFSARYNFIHSASGTEIGHITREGMRSLWRASYDIYSGEQQLLYHISEENPFIKLLDGAVEMIPIVGPILDIFQGMFLNPKYLITDLGSQRLAFRIVKKRSWHEGLFTLEAAQDPSSGETFDPYALPDEKLMTVVLSVLMMVLLEKNRG